MSEKYIYFFGEGKAEGTGQMKDVLGGKGAGLAEMTNLGINVPPVLQLQRAFALSFMKTMEKFLNALVKNKDKFANALKMYLGKNLAIQKIRCLFQFVPAQNFQCPE